MWSGGTVFKLNCVLDLFAQQGQPDDDVRAALYRSDITIAHYENTLKVCGALKDTVGKLSLSSCPSPPPSLFVNLSLSIVDVAHRFFTFVVFALAGDGRRAAPACQGAVPVAAARG